MRSNHSLDESLYGMRIRFGVNREAELTNRSGSHRANCADAEAMENSEVAERGEMIGGRRTGK